MYCLLSSIVCGLFDFLLILKYNTYMKKIWILLLSLCLLAGCSASGFSYSNLGGSAVQNEVKEVLEANGVSQEQVDTWLSWVNDYNDRVISGSLVDVYKRGEADYSNIIADSGSDSNCRFTAFELMKHLISTNGDCDLNDTYLMFDLEYIQNDETFADLNNRINDYTTLYNQVSVKKHTLKAHKKAILKAMEDRNVQFKKSNLSLIRIYLDSVYDHCRFVGHAGVLVDEGDELLFIEKYSYEAPFQVSKFKSRTELKEYLLSRQDLYGDDEELAPIVMENDDFLE